MSGLPTRSYQQKMLDRFHTFDTDRSGSITEAEFVTAAESKMLNNAAGFTDAVSPFSSAVIKVADTSGDGLVDHDEWARMLETMGADPQAAVKWADALDTDGDGTISAEELMASAVSFYTTDSSADPFGG